MIKIENTNFPFYRFEHLSAYPEIIHFVSSGAKSIGFADDRLPEVIRQSREELSRKVGFEANRWVMGHQIHSASVAVVTEKEAGRGAMNKESRLPDTDALVTDRPGLCLTVLSADCVPVLLYDPKCGVVAAVHAGWRGTVAQIVVRTVEVMQSKFNCRPEHILAGIGPSIGKCCFEVDEQVACAFQELFPEFPGIVSPGKRAGKFQVDLWEANRQELLSVGLKTENIEIAGMCTFCHPDHFFSFRRDGKAAGRFGAGIILR